MPRAVKDETPLRKKRLAKGLDQVQAGRRIGVSASVFGRLERGDHVVRDRKALLQKAHRVLNGRRRGFIATSKWGSLLRSCMDARGWSLTTCETRWGFSRYYWSCYIRSDLVTVTASPKELPKAVERKVVRFIENTLKKGV